MKGGTKDWPKKITDGNVTVRVYRQAHKTSKSGWTYVLAYRDAAGVRQRPKLADADEALKEARLKAEQLNAGKIDVAGLSPGDRDELQAIREICGATPPLAAVKEWAAASRIAGGELIAAANSWAARNRSTVRRILVEKCVDQFIQAMKSTGTQAERVYRSKLTPIAARFAGRNLDSITTSEWTEYLSTWTDGVSRNDFRKRAITMCRWARSEGYLPRGVELEISATRRSKEKDPEIGILSPEDFGRLLRHVADHHPQHLAALVLAGFCGIRSDEIHGKREDREKRQRWEDVILDPKRYGHGKEKPFVQVSIAKTNTPAWRHVPLVPSAVEWLKRCPAPHEGNICLAGAMEKVRAIGLSIGLRLPENCFRHSYITYQVAITGDKPRVATWAGTSVSRIDKHYRRPVPVSVAKDWFAK